MKKTRRTLALCLLLAEVLVFATGCVFRSVDELYAVPQAPAEYWALQSKIKEVRDRGGEYIAPLGGEYIQSVQLQDLDGDGVQEVVAFFRISAEEKPLKIHIYRQVGGEYELDAVIEETGAAINSVSYENLDGSPAKEVVVDWQISDIVHSLTVYAVDRSQVVELMRTDYTEYRLCDLDMDNQKEVLVIRTGAGEGENRAELYNSHDGVMGLESTAPLSRGISGVISGGITAGYLRGDVPAVFVPFVYGEKGYITDVFAWSAGTLLNVTLDEETQESESTLRWYNGQENGWGASDINGDNVTEIPLPVPLDRRASEPVNFWSIRWRQYDMNGLAWPVFTTYHNERDGWYFILPDEWEGKITLERRDLTGGGERAVVFSYRGDGGEPDPFLTIYWLTGSNRQFRAGLGNRFSLLPNGGAEDSNLYVAELHPCDWDCGLDEAGVIANFSLIKTDWSAGTR